MLSRTANNLFWLARYLERAENIARVLDVGLRMSSMGFAADDDTVEWHSAILASGCEQGFYGKHGHRGRYESR